MAKTLLTPQRGNWVGSSRNGAPIQYILSLVNVEDNPNNPNLNEVNSLEISEFVFKMSPSNIDISFPFSTYIEPTQGGIYRDSKGMILGDLTISGTTGLRPNKSKFSNVVEVSDAIRQGLIVDSDTLLPVGEQTGFDEYIKLRNFLKTYSELQKVPEKARKYVMVFQNGRDEELLVVEPLVPRHTRGSRGPHVVDYELPFKILGPFDGVLAKKKNDFFNLKNNINQTQNLLSRYRAQITYYLSLSTSLLSKVSIPGAAAIRDTLIPIQNMLDMLNTSVVIGTNSLSVPGGENITATVSKLKDIVYNVDFFETKFNNIDPSQPLSIVNIRDPYLLEGTNTDRSVLSNSLKNLLRSLTGLKTIINNERNSVQGKANAIKQNYDNLTTENNFTIKDSYDGVDLPRSTRLTQAEILTNETIQDFARRTTGSINLWKYIVSINNLKAPYIAQNGDNKSVKTPGSKLLVPSINPEISNNITKKKTSVEDNFFGTDLKLIPLNSNENTINSYDVCVGSTGDLETIKGVDNVKQAVTIKFSVEQGELKLHEFFGALYPIGTKYKINSIIKFKTNSKVTLLTDSRIQSIQEFSLKLNGDILSFKCMVKTIIPDSNLIAIDLGL